MGARMELDSRQPAFCFRLPPAGFELHPPKIPLNQRHLSTWSCKPSKPPLRTSNPAQPSPGRPRHARKPRIRWHPSASSLAPGRIPSCPAIARPHPPPAQDHRNKHHHRSSPSIIPRLPPNKLPTLPAGRTAYIPLQQPGTTAAACRIPLSSSLLTHLSFHPPHILSTTLDRQPAGQLVSQSQKRNTT